MKNIIVFFAFSILVNSIYGQSDSLKASIEQEIRKLDAAHADAVLRGDLAAMDTIWTEDFIVNNPFNEIDKADRIRSGVVSYSSFLREIEAVRIYENTAIVMGKETVVPKGKSPEAGKTIHRRYTNIWMMRDGKWRLVARHASVICNN
jgi:ketosteroid isomerase-like protein